MENKIKIYELFIEQGASYGYFKSDMPSASILSFEWKEFNDKQRADPVGFLKLLREKYPTYIFEITQVQAIRL